jgi:hypothetical protein
MSGRERRYETLLRLYPKSYRSVRGDEMLGTLLEATTQGRRLGVADLLYMVVHALRVRLRLIVSGPTRGPLPQPVRLVTWILNGLAVVVWTGVITSHPGPKNPGVPWQGIVAGFVFVCLSVLLVLRRRAIYLLVIGVLLSFVCSIVVASGPSVGAIMAVPYSLLVALLVIGWHRYAAPLRARLSSRSSELPPPP